MTTDSLHSASSNLKIGKMLLNRMEARRQDFLFRDRGLLAAFLAIFLTRRHTIIQNQTTG